MAIKKTSLNDLKVKAEAAKKADVKTEAKKAEVKVAEKKAEVKAEVKAAEKKVAEKKVVEKAPAKKAAAKAPAKAAEKKAVEKKPAEKKAAAPKKAAAEAAKVELFVEYQGGSQKVDDLVAKAKEVSGKKSIKELNIYYQPENNKVYYTADGAEGSFDL